MADLSLIRESFGSFEVRGASGVVLIGAGVMVGGAIFHFGKKAYDSYKILVHLNSILTGSKMH